MERQDARWSVAAKAPAVAPRAVLYLRVSTGRQAEHDLSIPDQRAQASAWCAARGYQVVAEYIEPGASAMDDKRPEFQRMVERACDGSASLDVVVVHSFSRFFRDAFHLEFYVRKLAKHGVKLVSITQELGDDPAQVMMRQVIALFDEYQSRENAKHVLRSMKENARQGYWNGAKPPYGYTTVEVERRGTRIKKRLAVDAVEAEFVRLVYRLFLEGHNASGPMGIKAIVVWLNEQGHRTRGGSTWSISAIHDMLTNPVYAGRLRFNVNDSRSRRKKAESEHVFSDAPSIMAPDVFDKVQSMLRARNPRVTAPRVITGPILLTGLAVCATCAGGMTLRTGTSKSGEVYRYYTCSTCARHGKQACKGRSIRMDKLDGLVTDHLVDGLLKPERLRALLASLAGRRATQAAAVDKRLAALGREVSEAEGRLRRLYQLVEDGHAEMDDFLRERILTLKAERDRANATLDRARSAVQPVIDITVEQAARFGTLMRKNLTSGEIPFRKAYMAAIIDRVEVDDRQIRIVGRKDVLEQAVLANGAITPGVRSFVRKWRT